MSFFRKVKGSVSLILILVMLPMMTYATLIVDGIRISSAKTALSGAGDLTMNAALSEYDQAMEDIYGLFAISKDLESLQNNFTAYFSNTLEGQLTNVGASDSETKKYIDQLTDMVVNELFGHGDYNGAEMANHLAMDVGSLSIKGNTTATLANPAVLKTQIVEYMKYKAPMMFVNGLLDQLSALKDSASQSEAVQSQITYTQSLDALQKACNEAKTAINNYNNAVIDLETATKGDGSGASINYIHNLFVDGKVRTELEEATKNMLYFKNLVPYWDTERDGHFLFTQDQWNQTKAAIPTDDYHYTSLETNGDGTYTRNAKSGNGTTCDVIHSNELLDFLNQEIYNPENADDKIRVKDISGGKYHDLFYQYENIKNSYSNLTSTKDCSGFQFSSGNSDYSYIVDLNNYLKNNDYKKNDLANYCKKCEEFKSAYEDLFSNYDALCNAVRNKTNAELHDDRTYYDYYAGTDEDRAELSFEEWKKLYCYDSELRILMSGMFSSIVFVPNEDDPDYIEVKITNPTLDNYASKYNSVKSVQVESTLTTALQNAVQYRNNYKTNADTNLQNAWNAINDWKGKLEDVAGKIDILTQKLSNVETEAEKVRTELQNWQTSIDATPEGRTKNSMQATHDSEDEKITKEEVTALSDFAKKQKEGYDALVSYLKTTIYFGEKVYDRSSAINSNVFVMESKAGKWFTDGTYSTPTTVAESDFAKIGDTAKNLIENKTYYKATVDGTEKTPEISATIQDKVSITLGERFNQFGFAESEKSGYPIDLYFRDDYDAREFYIKLINLTKEAQGKDDSISGENVDTELGKKAGDATAENVTDSRTVGENGELDTAIATIGAGTGSGMTEADSVEKKSANDINRDKDGDNNGVADAQKSNLASSTSFLSQLGTIVSNVVEYAYVEEYFTEMFSCYTTNMEDGNDVTDEDKKEIMLSGEKFGTDLNVCYRYEQEYILWGSTDLKSNVTKTMASIFGIRFVMNTIYAFTDSEIQAEANAIATALVGWTGFGIPLVAAIITVIFSVAESAYDLMELAKGNSVPVYKSVNTWVCKGTGVAKTIAIEAGKRAATAGLDKINEILKDFESNKIDELKTNVDDYIQEQIDTATDQVKGMLNSKIKSVVWKYYGFYGKDMLISGGDAIREEMLSAINSLNVGNDTIIQQAINEALSGVRMEASNLVNDVISSVQSELDATIPNPDQLINNINLAVDTKINLFVEDKIKTKVENFITQKADQLTNYVNGLTDTATDAAKEKITKLLNDFQGKPDSLTDGITDTIDSKDQNAGLCMNYKQYVKIFMLIGMIGNQDDMLKRCAALIQINLNKKDTGTTYDMTTAYTLVEADAEVDLRTIFNYESAIDTVVSDPDEDTEESGGIYGGLNGIWSESGDSILKYHSAMGY